MERSRLQVRIPASSHAKPGVNFKRASEGRLAMIWRIRVLSISFAFPCVLAEKVF